MITKLPNGFYAVPLIGGNVQDLFAGTSWDNKTDGGNIFFVDGDNGSDGWDGHSPETPTATIQGAVNLAAAGAVIYVKPRRISATGTDPVNYAETIIIPNEKPGISIIGANWGRTQGGLPQIKIGAGSTAMLTIRAPGCLIANLGFNGGGSTGGGILLDDNGTTKVAMGTTIMNCHFKNCAGTGGINGKLGGAIQLSGAPWQILIKGNRFYKNLADITTISVAYSDPQDIVIEDNIFSSEAANTDLNVYITSGAAGALGIVIRNNVFPAFPNITSGVNKLFCVLTGCTGVLVGNVFGGNGYTFKAAGTGGLVPATMLIAGNSQEATSASGATGGQFSRAS